MISLEQIFNETEFRTLKLLEIYDKDIVESMEREFNLSIPDINDTYDKKLSYLTLNLDILKYRYRLMELLKEKNYIRSSLINEIINTLCRCNYNPSSIDMILRTWLEEGSSVSTTNNLTTIMEGKKTFSFMKFTDYFAAYIKGTHLERAIMNGYLNGFCHDNAYNIGKNILPESTLITSQLTSLYGGYLYHSYVTQDGYLIDITNNCVCLKKEFDTFFNPYEIYICPAKEIDQRFEEYTKLYKPNNYYKLLQLALNEKRKTYL